MKVGEKGGVGDQEHFRKIASSLQTNLFAGVKSLSLTYLFIGPPEGFARLTIDLQAEAHDADPHPPANRGLPVQVGAVPVGFQGGHIVLAQGKYRKANSAEVKARIQVEKTGQFCSGGRRQLRLLHDAIQIKCAFEVKVSEGKVDVPGNNPGPP